MRHDPPSPGLGESPRATSMSRLRVVGRVLRAADGAPEPVIAAEVKHPEIEAGLARRSLAWVRVGASSALVLGLSTMVASCLVTSSPTYEDPVRTAPFFLPDRFTPDPRKVVVLGPTISQLSFEGFFVGEDAGDTVEAKLLLDYGWADGTLPYRDSSDGIVLDPPGALDGDPRRVRADYRRNQLNMSPGCHRLTLMVSHGFDTSTGCPSNAEDYALITWTVLMRDENEIAPIIDLTLEKEGTDPSCPPVEVTASCATPSPTSTTSGDP